MSEKEKEVKGVEDVETQKEIEIEVITMPLGILNELIGLSANYVPKTPLDNAIDIINRNSRVSKEKAVVEEPKAEEDSEDASK